MWICTQTLPAKNVKARLIPPASMLRGFVLERGPRLHFDAEHVLTSIVSRIGESTARRAIRTQSALLRWNFEKCYLVPPKNTTCDYYPPPRLSLPLPLLAFYIHTPPLIDPT